MNIQPMRFLVVIMFWALAGTGCVTKSKADAEAHAAFIAGEKAARRQMAVQQYPDVTIIGPVKNHHVPWVDGLTLAQAITTADYLDVRAPERITITRGDQVRTLSPEVLLSGKDIYLKTGDTIEIQP